MTATLFSSSRLSTLPKPNGDMRPSVLASTVTTLKMTAGRGKGRLEWGKQHLPTVGTELESLSMHSGDYGFKEINGLDGQSCHRTIHILMSDVW